MNSFHFGGMDAGQGRRRQRGVTLIVAMVMLIIIGLASAAVMRGSLNADQVANNSRSQMLATQAAQIALQYCEEQIELDVASRVINIEAAPAVGADPVWRTFSNWYGNAKIANTVPAARLSSVTSSFTPATVPQCLAEYSNEVPNTVVVTARGFSPDYAESGGRTTAGSVVWVQSTNLQ